MPFAGPKAVLAYLARYTHRVAIANSRLLAFDKNTVSFKYKDYRLEGPDRYKAMTLTTDEFIRRFLIHVLPKGLHRIRHYGLFAKAACADNIARARRLLGSQKSQGQAADTDHHDGNQTPLSHPCPCCGGRMIIIEVFERGATPRHRPSAPIIAVRIDTS
jgi:Putative transposase